jgi:hypothetical protein
MMKKTILLKLIVLVLTTSLAWGQTPKKRIVPAELMS